MTDEVPDVVALTRREKELLARYAKAYGVSEDEAATLLVKAALARRVKKRTGKAPAKVFSIRRK